MSRVEPKENRLQQERRHAEQRGRRQPADGPRAKAESDKRAVEEALKKQAPRKA